MNAGWAALIGAVVAGALALATQFVAGWVTYRSDRQMRLSARLTAFMSSTHNSVLAISEVARAKQDEKLSFEQSLVWPHTDPGNRALNEIKLHDADELVGVVKRLDKAVVELNELARTRQFTREEWRLERSMILDTPLAAMREVGRRHIRRRFP